MSASSSDQPDGDFSQQKCQSKSRTKDTRAPCFLLCFLLKSLLFERKYRFDPLHAREEREERNSLDAREFGAEASAWAEREAIRGFECDIAGGGGGGRRRIIGICGRGLIFVSTRIYVYACVCRFRIVWVVLTQCALPTLWAIRLRIGEVLWVRSYSSRIQHAESSPLAHLKIGESARNEHANAEDMDYS